MTSLEKQKVYVLGPLELSPNQFAVGERSYAAIKGNMPRYNAMRQKLYLSGKQELADAIGELEARAVAAEQALESMTSSRNSYRSKLDELKNEFEAFKKQNAAAIRKYSRSKTTEEDTQQ